MWGAQEKSEGAHQKNFGRRSAGIVPPPHLQIASDATGQPRHYIWTDASRGLSSTAEFLVVNCYDVIVKSHKHHKVGYRL